jgi:hypothetical protein
MRDAIKPGLMMRGEVRAHRVVPVSEPARRVGERIFGPDAVRTLGRPIGWTPVTGYKHNDFLYEWGALIGPLLARQGLQYGIGGMYLEFANVAAPGDTVTPVAFGRDADEGADYYSGLAFSPTFDYLRVPLTAVVVESSDPTLFPKGNAPRFFAQTAGVAGVHGKPFSAADNSTVIGGALVAFVDEDDHTRDLVLSRFYFAESDQQPKLDTSQVGLDWRVKLL